MNIALESLRLDLIRAGCFVTKMAAALELGLEHLRRNGFRSVAGQTWDIKIDRAKKRCGLCSFRKRTIFLSKYYLQVADAHDIEDTILHEIAHIIAGPNHGHDMTWMAACRMVGAKPKACSSTQILAPSRYQGECADCGYKCTRDKKLSPFALLTSSYFHPKCKYKANGGKLIWYEKGKQLNWPKQIKVTKDPFAFAVKVSSLPIAAQTAIAEVKSDQPSQDEINELWARLDKLEGK